MKPKSTIRDKPSIQKAAQSGSVKNRANPTPESANGVLSSAPGDVMTLAEVAAFLRATEGDIKTLAEAGTLPARRVGGEWRFLRSALCNWLSQSEAKPALSSKDRMLAQAGAWKEDETFPKLLEAIQANRNRLRTKEAKPNSKPDRASDLS